MRGGVGFALVMVLLLQRVGAAQREEVEEENQWVPVGVSAAAFTSSLLSAAGYPAAGVAAGGAAAAAAAAAAGVASSGSVLGEEPLDDMADAAVNGAAATLQAVGSAVEIAGAVVGAVNDAMDAVGAGSMSQIAEAAIESVREAQSRDEVEIGNAVEPSEAVQALGAAVRSVGEYVERLDEAAGEGVSHIEL